MSEHACYLCGKGKNEVKRLVKGKGINGAYFYICNTCVEKCSKAIARPTTNALKNVAKFTPELVYEQLNEFVEGQDEAKKILSIAVYTHYQRVYLDQNIEKSNILLIGPTGSGKTFLVELLGKILDVPVVIIDATSLTEAGFAGDDVEVCIHRLLQESNYDVELAERGIIMIDEVDKLKKTVGNGNVRDVSGEGVQHALLKLMESKKVTINNRKSMLEQSYTVNTKNILFICAGAFTGLDEIVKQEFLGSNIAIGHSQVKNNQFTTEGWSKFVSEQHLRKYGLIPEFIGRLPVIASLTALNQELLERILLQSHEKSVLKQMQKRLQLSGSDLYWTKDAISKIASLVLKMEIGARGLRSIFEKILADAFFTIPNEPNCVVVLNDEGKAIIQEKTQIKNTAKLFN